MWRIETLDGRPACRGTLNQNELTDEAASSWQTQKRAREAARICAKELQTPVRVRKLDCESCDGKGWEIYNGNHIERCDMCHCFDSDVQAAAHVRYLVTGEVEA